jgi:hypothetical protein
LPEARSADGVFPRTPDASICPRIPWQRERHWTSHAPLPPRPTGRWPLTGVAVWCRRRASSRARGGGGPSAIPRRSPRGPEGGRARRAAHLAVPRRHKAERWPIEAIPNHRGRVPPHHTFEQTRGGQFPVVQRPKERWIPDSTNDSQQNDRRRGQVSCPTEARSSRSRAGASSSKFRLSAMRDHLWPALAR